jgi:hypothetical protein
MTVREHLAQEVAGMLPEMVRDGIQQANVEHRRQHLERITQLDISDSSPNPQQQGSETNLDNLSS